MALSRSCFLCLAVSAAIAACICIAAGITGLLAGPGILQNVINGKLPLTPDSDQLDSWSTPPVPIYLQFWLWECVNVADFIKGEAKPMMKERGPFTYLEHREKVGVYFNPNGTVTYRQDIAYTFIRNMSWADETVPIRMINVPMVTIVAMVRNMSNRTQELVNFIDQIFNESLFVTHTAREWLWGYEDPLLKFAKSLPVFGDLVPDDKFGFFYNQNGTDDGLYTVFTGADDITKLNIINKWNGNSSLIYWTTPWANKINGTDGSWVPPLFQKDLKNERVYLFSTQICRSLYAKFESHSTVLDVPTETFSIPAEVFYNASLNPDNFGFGHADSGVLDVSSCNKGAPIYLSLPHLLYAADHYQQAVDGINPNPDLHRTILQIEPHSGLVISAQKRLQINVFLQADVWISDLQRISQVVLPAMWINESTTIDQKSANDLNNQILRYFTIVHWLSIVLIIVGGILIIIVPVVALRRPAKKTPVVMINGSGHDSLIATNDDE